MLLSKKYFQSMLKLVPIDFNKPWWKPVLDQKWLVFTIASIMSTYHLFWSLSPFFITSVLESGSFVAYGILIALWFCIELAYTYARTLNARFQLQCIHSIHQSAHQKILTVDPRSHTHRSSGMILGKIDRAARGYEDLLDQITYELGPLIISLISMVVAIGMYSISLSLTIATAFIVMLAAGYYFALYVIRQEQGFIASDDAFRSVAVENLSQVQLVRSLFASDYLSKKLTGTISTNMRSESNLWLSYIAAAFFINLCYLGALIILLGSLLWQIQHGITSLLAATGLAIAYLQNTRLLLKVIVPIRRYLRGWTAVRDLFSFIPSFGAQTFPVLGPATSLPTSHEITVHATMITFSYEKAQLFNQHTFALHANRTSQQLMLYGIIGPSGSGKTTLLSILGGQLKPTVGTVYINGVDIYDVTDATRRQLIALQGQTATSVKGTVKYNLLFGLPEDHGYTDQELTSVLQRVGLLEVLQAQQGLETMLGEGGLNISGGQRQRLNFAGLYLRAHYYKPALILVDEPTSSLDDLSEQAITQMIHELATNAITLVIAHRLKTVKEATCLFDLSLLSENRSITCHSTTELKSRSMYYRQLIAGMVPLE